MEQTRPRNIALTIPLSSGTCVCSRFYSERFCNKQMRLVSMPEPMQNILGLYIQVSIKMNNLTKSPSECFLCLPSSCKNGPLIPHQPVMLLFANIRHSDVNDRAFLQHSKSLSQCKGYQVARVKLYQLKANVFVT